MSPRLPASASPTRDAAWLIADVLSDPAARALAFGWDSDLQFDFPVACKTGTSSDFRDNWAFGYTPEFTVGVWVGNFDGSRMEEVSGVTGAAPILHGLFEHLHRRYGTTWYPAPTNLVERFVHPLTGKALPIADRRSPIANRRWPGGAVREKFLRPHLPAPESAGDYDARGRVRLAAEYAGWFALGGHGLGAEVVVADFAPALRIVSPLPGTIYYLDPDLPASSRQLRLRAEGAGRVCWASESLACDQSGAEAVARLIAGRHRLSATDPVTGARQETWIEVKAM